MSSIDTQSLHLQMRLLASQAQSKDITKPNPVVATEKNENPFSDLLAQSLEAVNQQQQAARELKVALEKGEDVELSEVMLQAQKASLSFQAMTQVRNKLTEAYKAVINMPI
jgi:flagellar hook-basal body complex protein FliE